MKKLFSLLGAAITFKWPSSIKKGYRPYADKGCNSAYNLLFCDKIDAFRKSASATPQGPWATLLAKTPISLELTAIAEDPSQESRLRLLAYNRLRELNQPVPSKKLFGVVIEVGMEEGLDVLAAYPDGYVRYINHKESMSVYESVPASWMVTVRRLMTASQAAVEQIGPWTQPRVAPPTVGMIRMSFLVSDGLYFGQGVLAVMENDAMAQPIINAGVALLKLVAAADATNGQ
jgi:hypothetical protein